MKVVLPVGGRACLSSGVLRRMDRGHFGKAELAFATGRGASAFFTVIHVDACDTERGDSTSRKVRKVRKGKEVGHFAYLANLA